MHILTATTHSVKLTTGSAVTTDYVCSWVDIETETGVPTPGSGQGNITTATTTEIIEAPASGYSRHIKSITVTNIHASSAQTVQLFKAVSASNYAMTGSIALSAGSTMVYDGGIDSGAEQQTVDRLQAYNTTGAIQVSGPAAGALRVITVPDAASSMARIDAGQTFTGNQLVNGNVRADAFSVGMDPTVATHGIAVSKTTNAVYGASIYNADTGSSARCMLQMNNNTCNAYLYLSGSGATTTGYYAANGVTLVNAGSGGIIIATATTADITFFYNSTNICNISSGGLTMASGKIVRGAHSSSDGTAGYTGTLTLAGLTSITVKDGLITGSA
jgi:hypothetical protein